MRSLCSRVACLRDLRQGSARARRPLPREWRGARDPVLHPQRWARPVSALGRLARRCGGVPPTSRSRSAGNSTRLPGGGRGELAGRPKTGSPAMFESPTPSYGAWRRPGSSFVDLLRDVAPENLPGAGLGAGPRCRSRSCTAPPCRDPLRRRGGHGRRPARHRRVHDRQPASRRSSPPTRSPGVAIAGAAGPAVELVKLFQVQLEHYEKIEGEILSLKGKANQLGQLVRPNLPAAMQGFVVVPLFAGYDLNRARGRVFSYDATGGKYEEADFQTNGSGGVHARNWIKATWREDISRDEAIDPRSGRCLPPPTRTPPPVVPTSWRGIFPTVARDLGGRVRSHPRRHRHRRVPRRSSAGARKERGCERPVLRAAGADDQGQGRLRAEEHRQGSRPHRVHAAEGIVIVTENQFRTLYKISEIYDRIAFGGVGNYNEFENLPRPRRAPSRSQGLPVLP